MSEPGRPPLEGVRVLDLADESLAYGGRLLADLGADVVLIEPPGGSRLRRRPPLAAADGRDVSLWWAFMATGKRSVTLDLTHPASRPVLDRLAEHADMALTTASRLDAPERGLDPDRLLEVNPRLVVSSVTPFGLTGPHRDLAGSDLVGWATSGILPANGDPDRAPLAPAGNLSYLPAALDATIGALLALRAARRDGAGQVCDVSVQEATIGVGMEVSLLQFLDGGFAMPRTGPRRPFPPIGHYPASDGPVAIVAYMPEHWDALAAWVAEETGVSEILLDTFKGTPMARGPYAEVLDGWLSDLTRRYSKQEFFREAQARGIPAAPVYTASDVAADPHLETVGAWVTVDHPDLGTIRYPRGPFRIDDIEPRVFMPPAPGAHNRAVYVDELGIDADHVAALQATGVV